MTSQASKPKAAAKKKEFIAAGKRYWKNPIHFGSLGTCTGMVTEEQETIFRAASPDSDIHEWTSKEDLRAKKIKELKNLRRKEIGLDPEE